MNDIVQLNKDNQPKDIEILIENEGIIYVPVIQESVVWETERQGSPGKLSFSVINDNTSTEMKLNIQEGNRVTMRYKGHPVFNGFVFNKKRNKEQFISIVAYDQLRYFKNKISIDYENKKSSELLKSLADDFLLQIGDIDDTKIAVSRREDNQTVFDVILNSLDETIRNSGEVYVLYDNFGKLNLKNIQNLKLDCMVNADTATNFDYETSIDNETYNRIITYYDNEKSGKREHKTLDDPANIGRWGVLHLYQKIDKPELADIVLKNSLKLYNSKRRSLSVSGIVGDIRARAGFSVPVDLTLGDINANSFLVIERAKHTFKNSEHFMDLTLRGGLIV